MKLGFVISKYPNEQRVPLLPQHIDDFENDILVEAGFGQVLGIADAAYREKGCDILSRAEVFEQSDAIFTLKSLQREDYPLIKEGLLTIGWLQPEGPDKAFWEQQGLLKKLISVDLNNTDPKVFYQDQVIPIPWLERNFIYKNSFNAGVGASLHGLINFGLIPNDQHKIAVLGSGNVAQGAMHSLSKFSANVRMFYRTTLDEFIRRIDEYDIVVNGISIAEGDEAIVSLKDQTRMKAGAFIIDAAAQPGGTIEGIDYTSLAEPIYERAGKFYYCVNNSPSVFYRTASEDLSAAFSQRVYKKDISRFYELVEAETKL